MQHKSLLYSLLGILAAAGCMNPTAVDNTDLTAAKSGQMASITVPGTGFVTVVHGVPGLVVDVYVNGNLTLPGFEPKTVTDPIELPEGTYDIAIVPQGGELADAVITGSATLPAGANASIIAHLAADGTPTLSVFVNDTSKVRKKSARVVVRHTAQAGAVDVSLVRRSGKIVGTFTNLTNPNEAMATVPAKKYKATIAPAGGDPIFETGFLKLKQARSYTFYAIGNPGDGSFDVLVQVINLGKKHSDSDDDNDRDRDNDDDDDDGDD